MSKPHYIPKRILTSDGFHAGWHLYTRGIFGCLTFAGYLWAKS